MMYLSFGADMANLTENLRAWFLPGAFALVTLVQLFYHWVYFRRIAFHKSKQPVHLSGTLPPVSVIICARNEYPNLEAHLPLLLKQDYPDFEVVVVNHLSEDDSHILLHRMQHENPNLKVVSLENSVSFLKGKKFPLSMGIRSASHELLLLTDADCRPAGRNWIRHMVRQYQGEKEMVLGYGAYQVRPGLLNRLIRLDALWVAIQYLGFALSGHPYMGVGRNLSYRAGLFYRAKGFTGHYNIPSGDDDLFVNKVAEKNNVAVEVSHESITYSVPKSTFKDWYRQKIRHLRTGWHYKRGDRRRLAFFSISQILFYLLFVLVMICSPWHPVGILTVALFLIRTLSLFFIIRGSANVLNEKRISVFALYGDFLLTCLLIIFGFSAIITKSSRWK